MQDVSNVVLTVDDNNIVSLKLKVKKTCKIKTNIVPNSQPMDIRLVQQKKKSLKWTIQKVVMKQDVEGIGMEEAQTLDNGLEREVT